jgi:hypothetical protein
MEAAGREETLVGKLPEIRVQDQEKIKCLWRT